MSCILSVIIQINVIIIREIRKLYSTGFRSKDKADYYWFGSKCFNLLSHDLKMSLYKISILKQYKTYGCVSVYKNNFGIIHWFQVHLWKPGKSLVSKVSFYVSPYT